MRRNFFRKLKKRFNLGTKIIVFIALCCWLILLGFIEIFNSGSNDVESLRLELLEKDKEKFEPENFGRNQEKANFRAQRIDSRERKAKILEKISMLNENKKKDEVRIDLFDVPEVEIKGETIGDTSERLVEVDRDEIPEIRMNVPIENQAEIQEMPRQFADELAINAEPPVIPHIEPAVPVKISIAASTVNKTNIQEIQSNLHKILNLPLPTVSVKVESQKPAEPAFVSSNILNEANQVQSEPSTTAKIEIKLPETAKPPAVLISNVINLEEKQNKSEVEVNVILAPEPVKDLPGDLGESFNHRAWMKS
jgi:hypothetical protein